jgi:hypothetical protein
MTYHNQTMELATWFLKESSTRVLPDLSLYNITLTPVLRAEIIDAQRNDEDMGHIKRRI